MSWSRIKNHLEAVNQFYKCFSQRLSHRIVPASIGKPSNYIRTTAVILGTGWGYKIIRGLAFCLGWQRHLCIDSKTIPVVDANGNFVRISWTAIQSIQFENAVFRTVFLIADFWSVEILFVTEATSRRATFMLCRSTGWFYRRQDIIH